MHANELEFEFTPEADSQAAGGRAGGTAKRHAGRQPQERATDPSRDAGLKTREQAETSWGGRLRWCVIIPAIMRHLFFHVVELARLKGWQLDLRPQRLVDFLLSGKDSGVKWGHRCGTGVRGGETSKSTVTFRSEAIAFPGTVLRLPKSVQIQIDPRMGKVGALKGIVGTPFNWNMKMIGLAVSASSFQEVGTRAFLDKYLVLAPDAEVARRLVGAVERDLLNWPATRLYSQQPMVIVNPDGVTVRVVREGSSLDSQLQDAGDRSQSVKRQ